MKTPALLLGLGLLALPAAAELAPNHQRLAELRAVIDLPAVTEAFGPYEPVERIERTGEDLYRVTAAGCHLDVRIVAEPMPAGLVGARRFRAEAGEKTCP